MHNLCECGCKRLAPICKKTNSKKGYRKGVQLRFIANHQWHTNSPSRADSSEWTNRPRPERLGNKHPLWKEKVTYGNLHTWLNRRYPRKGFCTKCSKSPTEYANISKNYLRNIEDWIELCRSCHRRFDGQNGSGNYNAKLTEEKVKYIRDIWKSKYKPTQKELAIKFNVSRGLIGHIVRGKAWVD
jgi:hypothetical protein